MHHQVASLQIDITGNVAALQHTTKHAKQQQFQSIALTTEKKLNVCCKLMLIKARKIPWPSHNTVQLSPKAAQP